MSGGTESSGSVRAGPKSDSLNDLPHDVPVLTFGQVEGTRGRSKQPLCIIIAGPNGAGKTTFAKEFLPKDAGVIRFVNADLIAAGLSPLRPELAALASGRLFLAEIDRWANARQDFAFETTLSGHLYLNRIKRWKASGYRVAILFLQLASPEIALKRIAERCSDGRCGAPLWPGVEKLLFILS